MKETIKGVMNAFARHGSNISSESKNALKTANELLQELLEANLSEDVLKKQADIIIAGAIITVLIMNDNKYSLQSEFGDKYLYPLGFSGALAPGESRDFNNVIPKIGERVLIAKDIPFTGTIDYRVFPLLEEIGFGPDHFTSYKLNTDPNTMDTTKRSQLRKDSIQISNKIYDIEAILKGLRAKIGRTAQHSVSNAPSVAIELLSELTSAKDQYQSKLEAQLAKSHEDFQTNSGSIGQGFIQECTKAIGKAKSQLVNDLDWGPYLQNLLINIANTVISGYNKVTGKNITFFEVNVANSVKEIEASESKLKGLQ